MRFQGAQDRMSVASDPAGSVILIHFISEIRLEAPAENRPPPVPGTAAPVPFAFPPMTFIKIDFRGLMSRLDRKSVV